MPHRYLCSDCRELLIKKSLMVAPPHGALRQTLRFGDHRLYRCLECGAFASPPTPDRSSWSLNINGQPVDPVCLDDGADEGQPRTSDTL
ncbi:MAG: hypothetical protein CMI01_06970 [Oceanospirillaceae bacterium]|jgi:DNA-directed RNA polymerase subunit RPC12/RpoP|uniref:hypothetical protein n=1 Tax=Marinobacterium litorale TaxID=404770 RepID=UPI0004106008|nr:hypothetical protein [Marinobacterium litorale]MBS98404.1 hypothetical protein [Oceanospirillaceae bacterium]